MSELNKATTTQLNSLTDYTTPAGKLDEPTTEKTYWDNTNFFTYLGYYKNTHKLKKSIDALATYAIGRGWTTPDAETETRLKNVVGNGDDSFRRICWNQIVMKKVNGDAYTEVIRDENNQLLNLKPLSPSNVRVEFNEKGIIIGYWHRIKNKPDKFLEPSKIWHSMNDRVANEIHGVSVAEACKRIIDLREQCINDWARINHRSTIRILYADINDSTRITTLRNQYKEAIDKGEVLIVPMKKGDVEIEDLESPNLETFLGWIRYLDDEFYKAVGVSPVILGGSAEFTEAGSKIGVYTFDQPAISEQIDLEEELWSQVGIKVQFERVPSIKDNVTTSEQANTGQVSLNQASELNPQASRGN